jgi:hypothetical protein
MYRVMLGIFCLLSLMVDAQTIFSGGIYQNTTWTLAGSPYVITGSVVVFPGNTLTVEPGVEIRIDNANSSDIYIETRGTLNLLGSDQAPIRIRTLYDTSAVGWKGFKCTSSQGGQLNANRFRISNAEIPFDYEAPLALYEYTNCAFSYCGQAIAVGNEVVLSNCQFTGNFSAVYGWSYFTINNCIFQNNTTAINAYSTSFILNNSTFTENETAVTFSSGVFDTMAINGCSFLNNGSALNGPNNGTVENCIFSDNTVGIGGSYACIITNNTFQYNELAADVSVLTNLFNNQINNNMGGVQISGISSASNGPTITENEICGNINFNVNNNTNVNYSLLSNCFCGLDSTEIEQYLIDGYDDITKGLINYQVYDSSCLNVLSTVSKFNELSNVNEFQSDQLNVTNPFESILSFQEALEINSIRLMDISGKFFTLKSNGKNTFDTESLSRGNYFLVQVNEYPVNEKLIKL